MGNKPSNEKLFTTKSLNHIAKNNNNYILFIALSAALGGYDTAVISGAIGNLTKFFHLSPVETGWAISSALVGCLIGAFFSDFLSDTFGRKVTMLITAILFILNSVGTAFPTSFTMFVLFRIVGGIGVGSPVLRPRESLNVGIPVSSALILLGHAAGVSPSRAPRLKSRTAKERIEELRVAKKVEIARILAWLELNAPPLAIVAKDLVTSSNNNGGAETKESMIPFLWFIKRANVWQSISILPFFLTSPLDLIPPVRIS